MLRRRSPTLQSFHLQHLQLFGSTSSGSVIVPDVSLAVSSSGLDACDPHGQLVHHWGWGEITRSGADDIGLDASGRHRQILQIEAAGAEHRWLAEAPELGPFLTLMERSGPAGRTRRSFRSRSESPKRPPQLPRRGLMPAFWRRDHVAPARQDTGHRTWSAVAVAVAIGAVALVLGALPTVMHPTPPPSSRQQLVNADLADAFGTTANAVLRLAPATAPPAPAPTPVAAAAPLAAHESFGFLPYWSLPDPQAVHLASLTTVAYFSVDIAADGSPVESGPGWAGYQSQALADLITEAHSKDERVVLTATCFSQSTLDQLTQSPAAQQTLATSLVALVRAKNLDGVNLDFEGTGSNDRAGLDHLVATVSSTLHAADPHWQLTMDTYGSSAGDPSGFFDIAGLAPSVDAFIVMAYDMGNPTVPGPTAPLNGPGSTDSSVLQAYRSVVPANHVILGEPLYGYDWPTTGPAAGDPATGPAVAVAVDQIAATDTIYWDPVTATPWAVYQSGGTWHQVWFDDAASLAAKTQLADRSGVRGIALWALGMDGGLPGDQAAALSAIPTGATPPSGPAVPGGYTAAADAPPSPATPASPNPPGMAATGSTAANTGAGRAGAGTAISDQAPASAAAAPTDPSASQGSGSAGTSSSETGTSSAVSSPGVGGTGNASDPADGQPGIGVTSSSAIGTSGNSSSGSNGSGATATGSGSNVNGSGSGTGGSGGNTGSSATALFDGQAVTLLAWRATLPAGTPITGTVSDFASDNTSLDCLGSGPPLAVETVPGTTLYVAIATLPADCTTGTWVFSPTGSPTGAAPDTAGLTGSPGRQNR